MSAKRQEFIESHDYCARCEKYYPKSDTVRCAECGSRLRKWPRGSRGRGFWSQFV